MQSIVLTALENRRKPILMLGAGALVALLAACADVPARDAVVAEIGEQLPAAEFTLEDHVHLGPMVMWFARKVVGMAGAHDKDAQQATDILDQMRDVEVATYRVRNVDSVAGLQFPPDLERKLTRHGWTTFVRVSNPTEQTLVLAHDQNGEHMDGLFVLTMEPRELTIVRVGGRLDKIMALALAKSPRSVLDGKRHTHHDSTPGEGADAEPAPARSTDGDSSIALAAGPPPVH
jgi:hypothetical protein